MIDFIYIILRAFAIGLLISAPMGPIGILCIQRTLNKGRWAGFHTGLGASLSDLIYCLLTGLGMSFVTEFIETNRNILQIIGSAVLVIYAIYLIKSKKNPERPKHSPIEDSVAKNESVTKHKDLQEFITGFFLTFSNPLIVFLIIGLFARFNFLLPEYHFYHYMTGYLFIIIGAVSWWYVITKFVDKIRGRFSINTVYRLNIVIGFVILVMSLVGFTTGLFDYLTLPQIGKLL